MSTFKRDPEFLRVAPIRAAQVMLDGGARIFTGVPKALTVTLTATIRPAEDGRPPRGTVRAQGQAVVDDDPKLDAAAEELFFAAVRMAGFASPEDKLGAAYFSLSGDAQAEFLKMRGAIDDRLYYFQLCKFEDS